MDLMKPAGALVGQAHALVRSMVKPGITTGQLDAAVEALFEEHEAEPLFKGYPGPVPFPAVCCISVNEEVVHGIPSDRVLEEGDIVAVDTGCRIGGWCGDSAWTYPVGKVTPQDEKLLEVGEGVLQLAIEQLSVCRKWSEVAVQMADYVQAAGMGTVEDFVGHGIGKTMHEDPQVPNYFVRSMKKDDFDLRTGLVLAIEPMVNAGKKDVYITEDHWTVKTVDGGNSVHFEHTIALTSDGPLILTARPE